MWNSWLQWGSSTKSDKNMPSFPGYSFLSSETSTFFFCPAELSSVTLELSFLGLLARNAVKINCIFFQTCNYWLASLSPAGWTRNQKYSCQSTVSIFLPSLAHLPGPSREALGLLGMKTNYTSGTWWCHFSELTCMNSHAAKWNKQGPANLSNPPY